MLSIIEQKMCIDDRKVWSRDLEKSNEPATLVGLMTCMTAEMKSRMRATPPLRTGNSSHIIHHVTAESRPGVGHLAALSRSHLIGDHPSGLTKEQTTETMDPSPKTKGLRPYPRQ